MRHISSCWKHGKRGCAYPRRTYCLSCATSAELPASRLPRVLFPKQCKFNAYHTSGLRKTWEADMEEPHSCYSGDPEQGGMLWNNIYNHGYVIAHLLIQLVVVGMGATGRSTLTSAPASFLQCFWPRCRCASGIVANCLHFTEVGSLEHNTSSSSSSQALVKPKRDLPSHLLFPTACSEDRHTNQWWDVGPAN